MSRKQALYILLLPSLRTINARLGEPRVDDERWLRRQIAMTREPYGMIEWSKLILARWKNLDRRYPTVA